MAKEVATTNAAIYSVIAAGTRIEGTIETDKDIRLDGVLHGNMNCHGKMVMGASAYLKGTIACANAEILGKADADLDVQELLILRDRSVINGQIRTATLMIEPGAVFNGTCIMAQPEVEEETA